jgi:hypothetical protein
MTDLVRRLEIPTCGCSVVPIPCSCTEPCDCPVRLPPPCSHILSADHGLTCAEWAELLIAAAPDQYLEPPPPPAPALVLSRPARVAVKAQRRAQRVGLRHPGDLHPGQAEHVGLHAHFAANGRPVDFDLVCSQDEDDAEVDPIGDWKPFWMRQEEP